MPIGRSRKLHLQQRSRSNEFEFDQNPATEMLTLVVSREPLLGLPVGKELEGKDSVPVAKEKFEQLTKLGQMREERQINEGAKMTRREITRGMRLRPTDPAPAIILASQDFKENRLVARISLKHQ